MITLKSIILRNNKIYSGINIHDGNSLNVHLDCIIFQNNSVDQNSIVFSSISSNVFINVLQFDIVIYKQSKISFIKFKT